MEEQNGKKYRCDECDMVLTENEAEEHRIQTGHELQPIDESTAAGAGAEEEESAEDDDWTPEPEDLEFEEEGQDEWEMGETGEEV